MSGKAVENLKFQQIIKPAQRTGTAALYNGETSTTSNYIDTQGYDDLTIILNAGTSLGSSSVAGALYEDSTDTDTSATAITGADFTAITTSTDDAIQVASIHCADYERYMWVRTYDSTGATSNYSAVAILSKGGVLPESNSPVFDLQVS